MYAKLFDTQNVRQLLLTEGCSPVSAAFDLETAGIACSCVHCVVCTCHVLRVQVL